MLLVSLKKNLETYIYIEDITCPHKVDTNFIFDRVLKSISHWLAARTPEKIKYPGDPTCNILFII